MKKTEERKMKKVGREKENTRTERPWEGETKMKQWKDEKNTFLYTFFKIGITRSRAVKPLKLKGLHDEEELGRVVLMSM